MSCTVEEYKRIKNDPAAIEARVLLIGKHPALRDVIAERFVGRGYEVFVSDDIRDAHKFWLSAPRIDIVVFAPETKLLNASLKFVAEMVHSTRAAAPEVVVFVEKNTPYYSATNIPVNPVAQAMLSGISEIIEWPVDESLLMARLERLLFLRAMREKLEQLAPAWEEQNARLMTLRASVGLHEAIAQAERSAVVPVSVLISGERGTPTHLLAKVVHLSGKRSNKPFFVVHCERTSSEDLEATLWGNNEKTGVLSQAVGGTVVLTGIEHIPLSLQARVLSIIENRHASPQQGGYNVRLLATTSLPNLAEEVIAKRMRPDLFYRIAAISIAVTPLKDRRSDITAMSQTILEQLAPLSGRKNMYIETEALQMLQKYTWPGNDQELELVLARATLISGDESIGVDDLPVEIARPHVNNTVLNLVAETAGMDPELVRFEDYEQQALRDALEQTGGNITKAAQKLGIGRATFYRKIKKFGFKFNDTGVRQ